MIAPFDGRSLLPSPGEAVPLGQCPIMARRRQVRPCCQTDHAGLSLGMKKHSVSKFLSISAISAWIPNCSVAL